MTKLFKMQLAALAIFISSSVSADMSPGSFSMFTMVNGPTGSCDRGISLVLDHGQVLGDFAVLSNFVYGMVSDTNLRSPLSTMKAGKSGLIPVSGIEAIQTSTFIMVSDTNSLS
jgi:hypothetical protein